MFKEAYRNFTDVIFANFIWILVSFLGVLLTLGASTTALFGVMFQVFKTKEPTNVVRTFKKSFMDNFVFSTLVYFCLLILGGSTYLMFSYSIAQNQEFLLLMSIVISYELIVFACYFFPALSIFETHTKFEMIKNIMILSNYHLWTNIKIIGSIVIVSFLIIMVHPIFLLFAIGSLAWLIVYHLKPVFTPYMNNIDLERNK